VYRNIRYTLDRGHPLQVPRGARGLSLVLSLVVVLASESLSRGRGRGNVVILKGFPRSVGRVGSRLYGFPCFPYSVISMACFRGARINSKLPKSQLLTIYNAKCGSSVAECFRGVGIRYSVNTIAFLNTSLGVVRIYRCWKAARGGARCHFISAYSARACFRMGISGSA
jgi:hypothetical protein